MSATLQVAHVIHKSHVDGPGARAVVYLQGCPIMCPSCQSPRLHDFDGGETRDVLDLARELMETGLPITISGGEPFAQAEGVANLLSILRAEGPSLHVIVYSGFVIEDLVDLIPASPRIYDILSLANVLVDGPYIAELDHPFLQWRGSSNQRPINLCGSNWWSRDARLEIENWDVQAITITEDGDVVGTAGQMQELFDEPLERNRMCGQVRG